MRLGVFLVFFVATFAVSCNTLVSAEKDNAARHLKGTPTDDLTAESEERSLNDIKIMKEINAGIKAAGLGASEKVSTAVVAAANAASKQQKALMAVKSFNNIEAKTTAAATTVAKDWKKLANAVEAGASFKKLDVNSPKWKEAFTTAKQTSKIRITEAQAAKITQAAAKQMAKNPSKSRKAQEFLLVSLGLGATVLVLAGLDLMIST
ncbi:hypothetical protein PHYSODRAFT_288606 [Phytophthora sojae]|uniref:RxLR effector protein n=2 Tax=Phytophthora sojae TaxID=67593 RepID=G5A631_PHYSP|nr:hypothetical protein PHYSODRAFT_288606 [Phytophthora sojae]AEK81052.1 Avh258 [Phytophthora sojae]EGZ08786.1 hypothetical protein PHYSODRAFT_288606 [Phytophthora sojae]|eukprot:XP_009535419.1 hypothetical protein PHYSODRAFT_288606 [Phytophthora sojae]